MTTILMLPTIASRRIWLGILVASASFSFVPAQSTTQHVVTDTGSIEGLTENGVLRDDPLVPDKMGLTFDAAQTGREDEHEEDDPALVQMPGWDFKAYVRNDISSFYQEAPGSRMEQKPSFQGQAGKFVNMSPEPLDLYWDSGGGPPGMYTSSAGPFASTGTSTFHDHIFYFVRPADEQVVCSFRVKRGTSVYYCNPFEENDPNDPSSGVLSIPVASTDSLSDVFRELHDAAQVNRKFAIQYKNFTGGSEWLTNYPSKPPKHPMWRADYFGQVHTVLTRETQFVALPPSSQLGALTQQDLLRRSNGNNATRFQTGISLREYREPGLMNVTLTAISVAPRIFQIDNFLSDVEVDHLLDLAYHQNLARSTTGSGDKESQISTVRTSRNTWLPRHSSPILDAIVRRAADVLRIDEALFRHRGPEERADYATTRKPINEDLQIVHYNKGEQYTAHHDFGYPDTRANAPSRSINLCMYLNEGMEGGETAFPRWRNGHTTDAIKAVPKRGKAMIFYMRTPDGNLDDLSQHAAMPVLEGEKWFSNLWIWDPQRE